MGPAFIRYPSSTLTCRPGSSLWSILLGIILSMPFVSGQTLLSQQDIRSSGNTTWQLTMSPYRVQQTLVIPKGALVLIEPGVRLEFLPGTGLLVQGALRAMGKIYSIRLNVYGIWTGVPQTTHISLNFKRHVRLVRGTNPAHGQIQLFYRNKWRSVCTHSYNWTAEDIGVACVQMGYREGLFDAWVDHVNDTDYMLLQRPRCSGVEGSLVQCADYSSVHLGKRICEGHPDMLIRCLRHSSPIQNRHWMGIQFANASYTTQFPYGRTLEVNVTQSLLQHVDVYYAGSGPNGQLSAAIEAIGAPPIVNHCTVQFSAFNGLNFTHTTGAIQILESKFRWNKGHGISINSTEGNITIGNVIAEYNAGDGIHYVHNDTFLQLPDSFCTRPHLGMSQSYPVYASVNRPGRISAPPEEQCIQKFTVQEPYVLTVHFLLLEASGTNSGYLEIRDGIDSFSPLLGVVEVKNGTRPESISTNGNRIWLRFRSNPRHSIRLNIKVTAALTKEFDLNVTNSMITGNQGRGIAVSNMRSGVYIERTIVQENAYRAGIHVEGGAGDVNVSYSLITKNIGDGINMTYHGGRRNITVSKILQNQKRGIAIGFNETYPVRTFVQETHITETTIEENWRGGILHGNFCVQNSLVNITSNNFSRNQDTGVEIWSCLTPNATYGQNVLLFKLEWNTFTESNALALKIKPAALISAHIGNNTFVRHRRGAIWIQNMDHPFDDEWDHLPAEVSLGDNGFFSNEGPFVVLIGLSDTSPHQTGRLRYNRFMDNTIIPATAHIRRHQSEGILIVGSSNILVTLNTFDNPRSPIWLASHLRHPGKIINVTANWWGTTDESVIYSRIFSGKDRYDLSGVTFRPYLARSGTADPEPIAPPPEYRRPFVRGNVIGGLYGERMASISGEYTVDSDLILQPNSILTVKAGTRLLFDAGIGILSQGKIVVEGTPQFPVVFEMKQGSRFGGFANESMVRLVGGPSEIEGRLEVFVDGEWGTVCNEEWTIKNAGTVCRQLGLAHAPEDFSGGLLHYGPGNGHIFRSNVKCDNWDWDIIKCPHFGLHEHVCTHLQDVGVKCRLPGWAGMRMPITAEQSYIEHAVFRHAGVLDFDTQSVSSALQIDFNVMHRIKNCIFEDNANAGLVILNNHLQSGQNVVQGGRFRRNAGSGLVTYSPGLTVVDGEFIQNGRSAFLYNPKLTRYQQREFVAFLERKNNWRTVIIPTRGVQMNIQVDNNQEILIKSTNIPHETNQSVIIEITSKDMAYVFGLQALNTPLRGTTETLRIFNGNPKSSDVEIWLLDERVNHLPATSVSYKVVVEYHSGPNPSGNIILQLTPVRRDFAVARQHVISLEGCTFSRNKRAIEMVHYDLLDQHDNPFEFPRRFNNESIRILNSNILQSVDEGLKVSNVQPWINVVRSYESAEFYLLKSLAQISYVINGTTFGQNGAGISFVREGYMNVEASGNIYQWSITKSTIADSTGPAFVLDFPVSLGKRNYAMWDKRYMRAEALKLEYDQMMEKFWQIALGQLMYGASYDFHWMEQEHLRRLGYASFHASTENLSPFAVHSLQMKDNRITGNRNSYAKVDGDFVRMNFTGNDMSRNVCPPHMGLFRVSGMEKEMMVADNLFAENQCRFVVEFDISSHTASTGRVPANFIRNEVRGNRGNLLRSAVVPDTNPSSFGIAVKGLQRVNVTRNILENHAMDYELICGLLTDQLDMELEVRENWWGTHNVSIIRGRIFDFDDWNCYAHAQFSPFLAAPARDSGVMSPAVIVPVEHAEAPAVLGGRLQHSLTLKKRPMPYIVNRDLTILPGVTLTIESGVLIEFFPNVGILVLGDLKAVGRKGEPVVFKPVGRSSAQRALFPAMLSQIKYNTDMGNVRLFGGVQPTEGYLEILNTTTNQWVPIWHRDFSVRDATVVCRHLNFPVDDVQVWRGPRVEDFNYVRTWLRPFYCIGNEARIQDCELPLMDTLVPGKEEMKNLFIFIRCQGRHIPLESEYWGGIRFARGDIELAENSHDASVLEDVEILAAGMLHGQKAAGAVEIVHRNPRIERVKITRSASNGLTVINPTGNLVLHHTTVDHSVLAGINILLLHGDLKGDTAQSTFDPVRHRPEIGMGSLPPLTAQFIAGISLGANIFGMVDICSADKVVYVRKRVLVLFRYDSPSLRKDCVKIFQVAGMRKMNRMQDVPPPKVAFRLLEWNMHQSEFLPNSDFIELYEGNVYNQTDYRILKRINATSNVRETFESAKETLTVHLSATTAPNSLTYGFIAEVVTLPPAYVGISREARLNVTSSVLRQNRRGGLHLYTTGEFNPVIGIERCLFHSNGEKVFHNFSTSYRAAYLDVQNTPHIELHNNYFEANQGGLHVVANSMTAATRTQAHIRSNVFHANRIAPALLVLGRSVSPYQEAVVTNNYLYDNTGQFTDTIHLGRIVGNFSVNQVMFNLGRYNMFLDGFGHVRLTDYQTVYKNSFIRNSAYGRPELHLIDFEARDKTTIFATGSGQTITHNILNNPENDLDLHSTNQTELFPVLPGVINARYNYWGASYEAGVAGKIKDKRDDRWLHEVEFVPFLPTNTSLMDGKCYPGFSLLEDSCYIYIGGVTTFAKAMQFCRMINASLPYADKLEYLLTRFMNDQQRNFDWRVDGAWVQSYTYSNPTDRCVYLRNQRAWPAEHCDEPHPFICERDTAYVIVSKAWHTRMAYMAAIVIGLLTLVFILILGCCWLRKSKQRRKQAFKRRESIRDSIRISRTSLAFASTQNLNGGLLGPLNVSRTNLMQIPNPPIVETHFPSNEDASSISKSNHTFNSSVEISPDYEFFEARNDALIFDPYSKVANIIRKHLTPSDLTFNNVAYIDSSNSRTSTRTDTMSFGSIDVKPDFSASFPEEDEEEEESPRSRHYRDTVLLETDM